MNNYKDHHDGHNRIKLGEKTLQQTGLSESFRREKILFYILPSFQKIILIFEKPKSSKKNQCVTADLQGKHSFTMENPSKSSNTMQNIVS